MNDQPLVCAMEEVGVYVDDPPQLVFKYLLEALEAMPVIGRLRVMVDGTKPGIDDDQRWDEHDLMKLRVALDELGRPDIAITLVFWAAATQDCVDDARTILPPLVKACGADSVEADLEGAGGWRSKSVKGFRGLSDAGKALRDALDPLRADGVRLESSTFPKHIELLRPTFAHYTDQMNIQVYPIAWVKRKDRKTGKTEKRIVGWDDYLGPNRRITEGIKDGLKALPDSTALTVALPAWRQEWRNPPRAPYETMYAAIGAWESMRAEHSSRILPVVSYWSWKWLVRAARIVRSEGTYARDFVSGLGL